MAVKNKNLDFHTHSKRRLSIFRLISVVIMLFLVGFASIQIPIFSAENTEIVLAEEEETAHSPIKEVLAKEIYISNAEFPVSPRFFQSTGALYLQYAEVLIPCLHLETDEQPPNFC